MPIRFALPAYHPSMLAAVFPNARAVTFTDSARSELARVESPRNAIASWPRRAIPWPASVPRPAPRADPFAAAFSIPFVVLSTTPAASSAARFNDGSASPLNLTV